MSPSQPSPEVVLAELKAGHARFREGRSKHPHATQARLNHLKDGQHPHAAILSCSDSRVAVELIFDSGFGDLFVIRNAGNACTPGSLASIEYAVEALNVPLLLVLGHSGCGAVGAACAASHALTPTLMEHVGHIHRDLQQAGLRFEPTPELSRAYGLHAQLTARNLLEQSSLLRQRLQSGALQVQAACFELDDLSVNWLEPLSGVAGD